MKERLRQTKDEHHENIREMFDVLIPDYDSSPVSVFPHSEYDTTLSFEKKHSFWGYRNQKKTIDQFRSPDSNIFFEIGSKKEIQFLTSSILGGVIHTSPIYIDETGRYFSKKVKYPENVLDAAIGLYILNVIAEDWDHEIPYRKGISAINYEDGSFFDFSHSRIAEDLQKNLSEKIISSKASAMLKETQRRLHTFAEEHNLPISQEEIDSTLRKTLAIKLGSLWQYISDEKTVTQLYEKIHYYELYQHDLLEPSDLRDALGRKLQIALKQM